MVTPILNLEKESSNNRIFFLHLWPITDEVELCACSSISMELYISILIHLKFQPKSKRNKLNTISTEVTGERNRHKSRFQNPRTCCCDNPSGIGVIIASVCIQSTSMNKCNSSSSRQSDL